MSSFKAPRLLMPLLALLAACSGAPSKGHAQSGSAAALASPNRHAPGAASEIRLSFSPVVKRAAPAVVNVYARRVVRQQVDPFWQLFGAPGLTRERVLQSLGSGVIVRSDGVIVTNNHVVEGGQEFMVVLSDRREFPARVLLADPRTDLAVLKIDVAAERLPVLPIDDSGDTQVGDLVLAIGNPFGVGQTVTNGIVSALNRAEDPGGAGGGSYIQTDAPINPGNSGGALVDMASNLIGINSFIVSRSGTSSGVGFAIPGSMVKRVVETAVGGGHTLIRSWLGAKTDPVTADIARSLGLATPAGALVTQLYPSGPAAQSGIHVGDVITSVNNEAVVDPANLNFRVATVRPGQSVQVQLIRNGKGVMVPVRVEAPAGGQIVEQTVGGRTPLTGATVANFTPALADSLGLDPFAIPGGVIITRVTPGAIAANAGLQAGDLVQAVNGRKVGSIAELQNALAAARGGWVVAIQRGGQLFTLQVG